MIRLPEVSSPNCGLNCEQCWCAQRLTNLLPATREFHRMEHFLYEFGKKN